MPTYEFRCPEGHDFENFYRSIGTAQSTAPCPKCGKMAERVMSATGFAFKGSGFYLTDYGKNAHRGEGAPSTKPSESSGASESSAPAAASESTSSSKSESAPAEGKSKPEAKAPAADPKPKPAASKPSSAE